MKFATLQRAVALGALSGMRSTASLTALSLRFRRKRSRHAAARMLADPVARKLLPLLTGGELVADKLPFIPDRTDPLPLAGRALVGALAAGILAHEERESYLLGGAIGAAAAIAMTYATYHARRYVSRRFDVSDKIVAGVEDSLALGLGAAIRSA